MGVRFRPSTGTTFPLVLMLPVIPAILVGASVNSFNFVAELHSARSLWPWRIGHIIVVTALAAGSFSLIANRTLAAPYDVASLTRNLIGLMGLALLGAFLFGASLSWIPPVLWTLVPAVIFGMPSDDPPGIWTFLTQPSSNLAATSFASILFISGVFVIAPTWPTRLLHKYIEKLY